MVSYLDLADEDKDSLDWDKRKDNRDMDTMVSWDPPELGLTDDMVKSSFQQEKLYSRTRQLVLRSIASAVYMSEDLIPVKDTNNSTTNGESCTSGSLAFNLNSLTSSLQSHWATCCKVSTSSFTRHQPPKAPTSPCLSSYFLSGQVDSVLNMLGVATRLQQGLVDNQTKDMMEYTCKHLGKGLEVLFNKISSSSNQLLERGEILQQVVWLLESVGLTAILCGVILSLIRGGGGGGKGGKKGKKGKGAVLQKFSELVHSYTNMLGELQGVAKRLLELIETLEANIASDSLTESIAVLAVTEVSAKEAEEVVKKMEKSYTESFYQIKTILKNKQNYLSFLRL